MACSTETRRTSDALAGIDLLDRRAYPGNVLTMGPRRHRMTEGIDAGQARR